MRFPFITARKRSLVQGNVLTPVCHSVHGGVCPTPIPAGRPGEAWADWGRGLGRPPPPGCRPPSADVPGYVNKQAVRILLDCILASNKSPIT